MIRLLPLAILLAGCGNRIQPPAIGAPGQPPPSGDADLGRLMVWICAVSFVGLGVSIAALVWLPLAKRTALAGALGFLAMISLAITVKALLPYLLWLVVAKLLLGGALGVWFVRRHLRNANPLTMATP